MDNKASKTRALSIAFLIDPSHLERLAVVLGEIGDASTYTVKFSDGSTVDYNNVKEIVGLPNPTRRSITSMIANTANTAREGQSASVILKTSSEPYVEYTVNGPQQRVAYFGEQLDDWVATIKQWYSWFYHGAGSVVLILCMGLFPLFLANRLPEFFPKLRPWILAILAVAIAFEILIVKLFPKGAFAIGDGAKRQQLLSYVRGPLAVSYAISFLGSVTANWLKWP